MTIDSVDAIRVEIRRRLLADLYSRSKGDYRELVKREILGSLFQEQLDVVDMIERGERYIAMCCGRRSGKTNLVAKLIVLKLLEAGHNQAVMYVAQSLKIGKGLIWGELSRLVEELCLPWTLREHFGEIATDNGAKFFILGLNKRGQVDSPRGFDGVLFVTDETQEYEFLLQPLIDAVSPTLATRGGVFLAAGTPGYVCQGTWFEMCHGKQGFVSKHWTILDNIKSPRPGIEVIGEEKLQKGYSDDDPVLLREWYGLWVPDHRRAVAEYDPQRNAVESLPGNYSLGWRHIIGIDLGYDDLSAWCVLAVNPYGPERIVVHCEAHERLIGDQAVEITRGLVQRFQTSYVVSDPAAGGKTFFETFNAKYGRELNCQIRSARKVDKHGRVMFMNAELRTGRLQLLIPACSTLALELQQLQWKDDARSDVLTSRQVRDDLFDTLLYCLAEVAPWQPQALPPVARSAEQREIEERNRRARASRTGPVWRR